MRASTGFDVTGGTGVGQLDLKIATEKVRPAANFPSLAYATSA